MKNLLLITLLFILAGCEKNEPIKPDQELKKIKFSKDKAGKTDELFIKKMIPNTIHL